MAQESANIGPRRPSWSQDRANMAPRSPKIGPTQAQKELNPKRTPRWGQDGQVGAKMNPAWLQDAKDAPAWADICAYLDDPCGVDPKQSLGWKILNSMAMLRESRLVAAGLGSSRQQRRRRESRDAG